MNGILNLKNPITVDGKKVDKLSYDTEMITGEAFVLADTKKNPAGNHIAVTPEFDFALHFYLGLYAILAVNPELDIKDVERITGSDIPEVLKIGRNFIIPPAEDSQQKISEEE